VRQWLVSAVSVCQRPPQCKLIVVRSACPYDCPDTCGLLVTVENGQAVAVSGDPEHPYSKKVVYMEVGFPRPYLGEM